MGAFGKTSLNQQISCMCTLRLRKGNLTMVLLSFAALCQDDAFLDCDHLKQLDLSYNQIVRLDAPVAISYSFFVSFFDFHPSFLLLA
jgi:hypothetical protein